MAQAEIDKETHRKLLRLKLKTGKSIKRLIKDAVDLVEKYPQGA